MTPPKYEALNIQIKGHNYEVLENHQGYIHRLAENLGIEVSESWATACESFSASVYAPQVLGEMAYYARFIFSHTRNMEIKKRRGLGCRLFS